MQVELLQRMPMDIRLAASAQAAEVARAEDIKSKACLVDHLVGSWHVENALGIDGVTVLLEILPRSSSACQEVVGHIHYLGKKTQYSVSATPLDSGKLHVKYLNNQLCIMGANSITSAALPLAGIGVFLARPTLWKEVVCPLVVSVISTLVSLIVLFGAALRPQADALVHAGWPGWVAWISGVLLVLAEVAVINIILMLVLFGCVQSKIIRAVLQEKGIMDQLRTEFAQRGKELPEANCLRDLGHNLLFLLGRLPLMILTLPLHGVPVLGQVAWVMLNGWIYAWELEAEFLVFARERHRCHEQWRFVSKRFGAFAGFGSTAMALELIPFVGPWIFFASNACGAALLAEIFFKETHMHSNGAWTAKMAEPGYFHEGEYDLAKDLLLEDLGAVNGEKQNENMELVFKRARAS
ncbi:unnamed protein product [Symbiodinium pilosum]|uniref:Uncharacterized protein n=1 Tax=Symbiodinium pilosum TaxID=2952 RepID=A0A812KRN2_SYMPI|nr:unnamed protein product [Symbiodinium pilosum]